MPKNLENRLREAIIDVPDFPKPGILFRDVMPVLQDVLLRTDMIDTFKERYAGQNVTAVAGPESRGFLVGILLADKLGVPFVPIRKPGKLPGAVYRQVYDLEYGTDELQIHRDALGQHDSVVIIDDLLATGGTARAACELIEQTGATVAESAFVIELLDLDGRRQLGNRAMYSIVRY